MKSWWVETFEKNNSIGNTLFARGSILVWVSISLWKPPWNDVKHHRNTSILKRTPCFCFDVKVKSTFYCLLTHSCFRLCHRRCRHRHKNAQNAYFQNADCRIAILKPLMTNRWELGCHTCPLDRSQGDRRPLNWELLRFNDTSLHVMVRGNRFTVKVMFLLGHDCLEFLRQLECSAELI